MFYYSFNTFTNRIKVFLVIKGYLVSSSLDKSSSVRIKCDRSYGFLISCQVKKIDKKLLCIEPYSFNLQYVRSQFQDVFVESTLCFIVFLFLPFNCPFLCFIVFFLFTEFDSKLGHHTGSYFKSILRSNKWAECNTADLLNNFVQYFHISLLY